jgi:hypothetical protein
MAAMFSVQFPSKILLVFAFLGAFSLHGSSAAKSEQPVAHMKPIAASSFTEFIRTGNGVKVTYFYAKDLPGVNKFLMEMEKSAAIMSLYGAEFALIDCTKDKSAGYCQTPGSENRVYMFRKGRKLLDVSRNSMFDLNSIISNVLQVVLLYDVPILQSIPERQKLEADNTGVMDVVFSYQRALGTYDHRIMMEVVYAYRTRYRFAITNEQSTVQHLPGFMEFEESAVWLLRCKEVHFQSEPCRPLKYNGVMDRESLANFFGVLDIPPVHFSSNDDNSNPYEDSNLHTVYIYHDDSFGSAAMAQTLAAEISDAFLSQLGVIVVNVDTVMSDVTGYNPEWKLPALAVKLFGQATRHLMPEGDVPLRFIAELIGSSDTMTSLHMDSMEQTVQTSNDTVERMTELEVEVEDDEVAETASILHKEKMLDEGQLKNVIELTSDNFYSVTGNIIASAGSPLMVLFYITFDAKSEVLRHIYYKAATELSSDKLRPLAAINCYDWTDVCGAVNVSTYPTLRIYHRDGEPMLYTGFLSQSAIITAMKLWLFGSPVLLMESADVDIFLRVTEPSGTEDVPRVLAGFATKNENGVKTVTAAAKLLKEKLLFGISFGTVADVSCQQFSTKTPCIVVIRKNDDVSPFTVLSPGGSTVELVSVLEQAKLLSFPKLTAENFAEYNSLHQPFVIAFINVEQLPSGHRGNLRQILSLLAAEEHGQDGGHGHRNVLYGWMDVSNSDGAAARILHHHLEIPMVEELLVIDRTKNKVYQYQQLADVLVTVDSVREWLAAIVSNTVATSKTLSTGDWRPRNKPYDFLALVDANERVAMNGEEFEADDDSDDNEDTMSLLDKHTSGEITRKVEKDIEMELKKLEQSRLYGGSSSGSRPKTKKVAPSGGMHTEL